MDNMKYYRIMLVDDEPWALIGLKECIDWERAGFKIVAECDCGEAALKAADVFQPDAVITDIRMPDMSGLDLIRRLKEKLPRLECVIVSAFSDFEIAREAIRLMTVSYLLKPLQETDVFETAERLYQRLHEDKGNDGKTDEYPVVGSEEKFHIEPPVYVSFFWLVINKQPLSHTLWKKGKWCQRFKTSNYYCVLCEELPAEIPAETGISCAAGRDNPLQTMIKTAEASLNGGFLYPQEAGIRNTSSVAAGIQYYLYCHIMDNITLKDLSGTFFLTETYLCDLFKQETGKTILNFLKEIRMNRAAKLLITTNDTISEIAAKCGYNDYSYFGRHFKSVFGTTPDNYRKRRS